MSADDRRRLTGLAIFTGLMLVPGAHLLPAIAGVLAVRLILRAAAAHRAHRRAVTASARAAAGGAAGARGIRLGDDGAGRPVVLPEAALAAHGIILGASGSGKTTSLLAVLEDRIARGAPVVALDLKGSPAFATRLAEAAERAGRPFVVWSPDGPGHWNPLATGNPTELKDRLIGTERFSEPHYAKIAERYLQTVMRVLAVLHPDHPATLAETVALCDPRRLAVSLRGVPDPLRGEIRTYLDGLTPDALSGIRGIGTRLAILTESHTGAFLAPGPGPTVDLRAALRGEAVTVFSLDGSRYGQLAAALGTVAVQDLVSAAGEFLQEGRATRPGQPATVAIDEFSALGADQVARLFARARESGMSVVLSTQELADLDRAAAGLRDQIIGSTAFKLVHRQDVPASARAVSTMTGSERVWEETRQFGGRSVLDALRPRGSRREVERPVVHPDRIAGLRVGEAVLIAKVPEMRVHVVRIAPPRAPAAAKPPVHGAASDGARTPATSPGLAAAGHRARHERRAARPVASASDVTVREPLPHGEPGRGSGSQPAPGVTR